MEADRGTGDERYRLDVIAGSVVDAVRSAGGWMFDRALNGWDVTVLIPDCPRDVRPLHILGAESVDLESVLSGAERFPAALSVSAELYLADQRVRRTVQRALQRRTAEVTVWGGSRPPELRRCIEPVHHQLSMAASTYKLKALGAAGIHVDDVNAEEILGRAQRNPRVVHDNLYEQRPANRGKASLLRTVNARASTRG